VLLHASPKQAPVLDCDAIISCLWIFTGPGDAKQDKLLYVKLEGNVLEEIGRGRSGCDESGLMVSPGLSECLQLGGGEESELGQELERGEETLQVILHSVHVSFCGGLSKECVYVVR
jgi:hypothetical protein